MILPALMLPFALGVVCASLLAALAHLWRGRTRRELFVTWLAAQAGFWLVHLTASMLGASLYSVGDLQLAAGMLGAAAAIGVQIVAAH